MPLARLLRFAAVMLFACLCTQTHADVVIVEDGVSQAPIVVFPDAPPRTRAVAVELADYIAKISGARPALIDGEPDPLPAHAIWVGYQPVLDGLFPDIDFDFDKPEQIQLAANDTHVVIAGRDRWLPGRMSVEAKGRVVENIQQEYGTANAVYTFLQDKLGVRWLWPGELGEVVPEKATIAIAPFDYRYHPRVRGRSNLLRYSALTYPGGYGHSDDWVRRQRLSFDSLRTPGGHAFNHWWKRYQKDHPDYFALQPDGTRSAYPNEHNVKMCESNPGVWQTWIKEVGEQLEQDPNQTVFNASANDSWASGHCICEDCRAWDHPDAELRGFHWAGLSGRYVALSDRQVTFANQLGRLLKEHYPGKDYYVMVMAYGHSRPAPIEARPADNVIISSVANFFGRSGATDRGSPNNTLHKGQFAGWGEVSPHLIWRPNTGSPAGMQQGQADVAFESLAEDFAFFVENNGVGIYIDTIWEHWATQGPMYYLMGQLIWDPSKHWQTVMDDYYARGFGPAGDEMKAYWQLVEATRMKYVSRDPGLTYNDIYDQAFFDKSYGLLDGAAAKASNHPGKFHDRVSFVRAGLDHTRLVIEIRGLMQQWRETGGEDDAIADQVRARWARIKQITEDYPHGINWGPIRPGNSRMGGLHPDHTKVAAPSALRFDRQAVADVKLQPAEAAGWELALFDDFERSELGEDWQIENGKWAIENGELRGGGVIFHKRAFPGAGARAYHRVEFDAAVIKAKDNNLLAGVATEAGPVGDLSCFLNHPAKSSEAKASWQRGYFLQFGGKRNAVNRITRNGQNVQIDKDPKVLIDRDKVHRIVAENDQGQLRMFVDSEPILAAHDPEPMIGEGNDRIGFYLFTGARVDNLRVYIKPVINDLDLE